jgi:hypothetical protein
MNATNKIAAKVVEELHQTNVSSDPKRKAYNIKSRIRRILKEGMGKQNNARSVY